MNLFDVNKMFVFVELEWRENMLKVASFNSVDNFFSHIFHISGKRAPIAPQVKTLHISRSCDKFKLYHTGNALLKTSPRNYF